MTDYRVENIHVYEEAPIVTPAALKRELPLTETAIKTVDFGQNTIKSILDGQDKRLFVVVGPCSIHDVKAAKEYAMRLKVLADELADTLVLVMRVYFEKPRTRTGWQGLINDPDLDGTYQLEKGLREARTLLLEIAEIGLPAAGEALDLVTPQYVQDLFSWTAIGARTTESQCHRKMASGFSSAVGFKNGTDGNMEVAVNAIVSAASENNFLSVDPSGHVAVIRTKGNPYSHIVLRGGASGPNYDPKSIMQCESLLQSAPCLNKIMVDCSHANSAKNHERQPEVLKAIGEQIQSGNRSVVGVMIESNIAAGAQSIPTDKSLLKYGVSITDACIDWSQTEQCLRDFSEMVNTSIHQR